MDVNELRRLAQSAPDRERQRREEQKKAKVERYREGEWTKARQAVAQLEARVREWAEKGDRSVVVYRADGDDAPFVPRTDANIPFTNADGDLFPIIQKRVERMTRKSGSFWRPPEVDVVEVCEVIHVPDFAQFVFNSCPSSLNPRWKTFPTSKSIYLEVSW